MGAGSPGSCRWLLLAGLFGAACGSKALAPGRDASADASPDERAADVMSVPDVVEAPDCLTGVTAMELASTPRADTNLEMLALKLDKGRVVAEQATYDRLVRDVAVLRTQRPDLATITYLPANDGRTISLTVDLDTAERMKSGTYLPWQCLNARLGAVMPFDFFRIGSADHESVYFKLKGIYAIDVLASEYGRLPGVSGSGPGSFGAGGATICVTPGPGTWHYVTDQGSGDCVAGCIDHAYSHFTIDANAAVTPLEQWSTMSGGTPPAWVTQYASPDLCR